MGTGMRLSLSQIAAAVGGRLIGPDAPVTGPVVTDSRQAAEGSLFVAVHGERTDGHAHLGSARALGAVGAPDRITCTAYPTYKDAMDTMAPWTTQTTNPGAGTEQR